MGLKAGDLKDTVLKRLTIDEYVPKTGESSDVVVLGFYVSEETAGEDLFSFLSGGVYKVRDVEVTPNPNDDGFYIVFIELDRQDDLIQKIQDILSDVEKVAGKLKWQATTHLTDDYHDFPEGIMPFLITRPEDYMTKEEFESGDDMNEEILEFLKNTCLTDVSINENNISMTDNVDIAKLEIIKYGDFKKVMEETGLSTKAIQPVDNSIKKFNSMLGDLGALRIDEYIVIYNSDTQKIMVTREC